MQDSLHPPYLDDPCKTATTCPNKLYCPCTAKTLNPKALTKSSCNPFITATENSTHYSEFRGTYKGGFDRKQTGHLTASRVQ